MGFDDHHVAWLTVHPERSIGWFKTMLAEGFDVHHLDGNHGNNDPANLVLIETGDHMRLHGSTRLRAFGRSSVLSIDDAVALYRVYLSAAGYLTWDEAAAALGLTVEPKQLRPLMMVHAAGVGLPWPPFDAERRGQIKSMRHRLRKAGLLARSSENPA